MLRASLIALVVIASRIAPLPAPATDIRVHVRLSPDSAYGLVAVALSERAYALKDADNGRRTLSTDPRYVAGAGLMQVTATVAPDSVGSVVSLNGTYRPLVRFLHFFSAVSKDAIAVASNAPDSRTRLAWDELVTIGDAVQSNSP